MTIIFLLTVSDQYNAYNLILRLMAQELSCIPNTTETTILNILSKLMQDEKLGNSCDESKAHYLFEFNSDVNHCKPVSHSKPIRPVSYSKSVHPVRYSKPVRPINHCKPVCPVYCKSVRPITHSKSVSYYL